MKRRYFEDLLSSAAASISLKYNDPTELLIDWNNQEILLCNNTIALYNLRDKDGNLIEKDDELNEDTEIYSIDLIDADYVFNVLEVTLSDALEHDAAACCEVNNRISNWFRKVKKNAVSRNPAISSILANELVKQNEWQTKYIPILNHIKSKLIEYESACNEPDGNIMCQIANEINEDFRSIDLTYTNTWEKEDGNC